MIPVLYLVADPWKDDPTLEDNPGSLEARREEQRREEQLRAEALRLMDSAHLATFAEALERVRGEGRS